MGTTTSISTHFMTIRSTSIHRIEIAGAASLSSCATVATASGEFCTIQQQGNFPNFRSMAPREARCIINQSRRMALPPLNSSVRRPKLARINYMKIVGWFWLLLACLWLLVLGQSVRAMFSSPESTVSRYSEGSPLVAVLSVVFLSLFLLSGLAFVRRWRLLWWWQIPAVLALVGICYIFFGSGLTWRITA